MSLPGKQINCVCTKKGLLAIKMSELALQSKQWMNFKITLLNKRNQTFPPSKKNLYCMIPFT